MKQGDIIRIIDNLCKEIMIDDVYRQLPLMTIKFPPKLKYQFSRAKWYEAEYNDCYYDEVRAWCTEQFGPQPDVADAWTRWHHKYHNTVFFRDQKDYNWFVLRWGG